MRRVADYLSLCRAFRRYSRVREVCQIILLAPIAKDMVKLISIFDPV